jgi:hypothetical protein
MPQPYFPDTLLSTSLSTIVLFSAASQEARGHANNRLRQRPRRPQYGPLFSTLLGRLFAPLIGLPRSTPGAEPALPR